MTYELALKLKNAGFPQDKCELIYTGKLVEATLDIDGSPLGVMLGEHYRAPTLIKLIEACGDRFGMLILDIAVKGRWIAYETFTILAALPETTKGMGSTPEEAVAHLLLELSGGNIKEWMEKNIGIGKGTI